MILLFNKFWTYDVLLLYLTLCISSANYVMDNVDHQTVKKLQTYSLINTYTWKPHQAIAVYIPVQTEEEKLFGFRHNLKKNDLRTSATDSVSAAAPQVIQVETGETEPEVPLTQTPFPQTHTQATPIPLSQGQPFNLPVKQDVEVETAQEQEAPKLQDNHHSTNSHPTYEYLYKIQDSARGSNFGHKETRIGPKTWGEYFVHLPDGRMKTVRYWADDSGFHAEIDYLGEAQYPQRHYPQ